MTQQALVESTTRGRRMHAGVRFACLVASCVVLVACSGDNAGKTTPSASTPPAPANNPPEAPDAFVSKAWGFHIDAPPGWTLRHDFQSSYLANDAWKAFAASGSQGEPVLSLIMPGSNRITDAEIRIGASRDTMEVQHCTAPPSAVRGNVATERINGIDFNTFEAADAAMSHHLRVHAYRTVHDGTCYAIDLLVFGVNPQVYDPPATPPFSDAHAFEAMRAVLRSFMFEASAGQSAASASTAAR